MKIVKYVIKRDGVPILFNPKILHSAAIEQCSSAGFAIIYYDVEIDKFKVKCYGSSDLLQVSSSEGDCRIIQNYLNGLLCNLKFDSIADMQLF